MSVRDGCCADWPKPCSYHEGWLDGYEAAERDTADRETRVAAAAARHYPLPIAGHNRYAERREQ